MTTEYLKTEAICLHPAKNGNQTLFLTKENGPLRAFRIKDRLGQMDICSVLDLLLEKREFYYLKESTHREVNINPDYKSLVVVSYLTEVLSILPSESISEWPKIYNIFFDLIHCQDKNREYFNLLLFFQLKLLLYMGLTGDLSECNLCGKKISDTKKVFIGRNEFVLFCNKDRIDAAEEITRHEYNILREWIESEELTESYLLNNSVKRIQTIFVMLIGAALRLSNQEKFLQSFYQMVG